MVVSIFATVITCAQAFTIINKLQKIVGLNEQQKMEIVHEIKKIIPSCPVTVVKNGKQK